MMIRQVRDSRDRHWHKIKVACRYTEPVGKGFGDILIVKKSHSFSSWKADFFEKEERL